jgi:DNA (cytosine-5)-methyltransferase 1
LGGSRSGLFWEICRLLDETRAQNFILENVPGLLSSNQGKDMAVVLEALVERGYRVAYRVCDAQHWGVPQRRRRVFIVGCLGDSGRSPEEILAIPESRARYLETSKPQRKDTATATGASTAAYGQSGFAKYTEGVTTLTATSYKRPEDNVVLHESSVFPIDDARELEKHQNGTGIGAEGAPAYTLDRQQAPAVVVFSPSDFANYSEGMGTLRAGMTNNNSPIIAFDAYNHTVSNTNQTLRTGSDLDKMGTVFVSEKVVAPTLSASNNPSRSPQSSEITAQVDAMVRETGVVRRLTPMECERLQGFPDNWTDGQADSNRYKQMGNAVAVPVVEWIINRMVGE